MSDTMNIPIKKKEERDSAAWISTINSKQVFLEENSKGKAEGRYRIGEEKKWYIYICFQLLVLCLHQ